MGTWLLSAFFFYWRQTELTAIPDLKWTHFLVKILDRLSVAAMTINSYYAQAEEEQIVAEEFIAQCLTAWMSVNRQEIPGFDQCVD